MTPGVCIEVIYVDGRVDSYDFSEEQITIGSSDEASLSLELEELSPRHMLVVPRERGCWVSVARGVSTQVLLNGQYLDSQEVPWGSELDVGTVTLRIGEATESIRAREKGQRSLFRVVALAMVAIALVYVMQDEVVPVPKVPAQAPELFDDEDRVACSVEGPEQLQRGADLEGAATAYWQRYPFDAQEGIRAAVLYEEAVDCFSQAGEEDRSTDMSKLREEMVAQVNNDYQTLRLQLLRALKNKQHGVSKERVRVLATFVRHRPGEYLDWLSRVDKYLRRQA